LVFPKLLLSSSWICTLNLEILWKINLGQTAAIHGNNFDHKDLRESLSLFPNPPRSFPLMNKNKNYIFSSRAIKSKSKSMDRYLGNHSYLWKLKT
jgi:hypothetical protein